MIALEKTIETTRPIGQVFRYVSDFGNIEQWDPGVVSSRRTSPGGVRENATFDLTVNYGFGKIHMTYRMAEFVPDQKVVLMGAGKSFTATDTIEFSPAGRGTRIVYRAVIDLDRPGPVKEKLINLVFSRIGQKAVDGLSAAVNHTFPVPRQRSLDDLLDRTVIGGMFGFTRQGYARRKRRWHPMVESLEGRTAVITGATSGIGRAAAVRIADLGAHLILVGRSLEKLEQTRAMLIDTTGNRQIDICRGDLSLMADTEHVAQYLSDNFPDLHVLVNNAGALFNERLTTVEGLEQTLATDLAGPFLLTSRLIPRLRASSPSRIINVSSGGMYTQKIRPDDLGYETEPFDGAKAYARAKRGMVILTEIWAKQLKAHDVMVNAMHPGWVNTPGITKALPGFYTRTRRLLRTPEQGADTIVWLATAPEAGRVSGRFWLDRRPHTTHVFSHTRETPAERRQLWEELCRLTGVENHDE